MSIRQLEEDPLLETLEKVIPQVCNVIVLVWTLLLLASHILKILILVTDESDMSQDGSAGSNSLMDREDNNVEPLPGLETILEELLQEDGYGFIVICSSIFEHVLMFY